MKHETKPVVDEAIEDFAIEELFLSRTDERGVIKSGNSVFQRLSGYDWETLIGAPHRLIRHPDMPKGAFWMKWHNLKNGRTFGCYVKNRSSDGRYYWVYAVVVPVEGGYLSVRLKPSTDMLGNIANVYREVLQAEAQGMEPEDSARLLEEKIKSHGFVDYGAFMGYALAIELEARAEAMSKAVDPSIEKFQQVGLQLPQLIDEVRRCQTLFEQIKSSPTNLSILGSRLTEGREAMQVIAQNYRMLCNEVLESMGKLADGLDQLWDKAQRGRMGHCASLLYREAIEQFREADGDDPRTSDELPIVNKALEEFLTVTEVGVEQIRQETTRFISLAARLRQMTSGLAMTRIICRIESASIDDQTSGVNEIASRLAKFQEDLSVSLDNISRQCNVLLSQVPEKTVA